MSTDKQMAIYDAVGAYGDAVSELADAFHDREGVDRDMIVTLEDAAGRAREAIDRAVSAGQAEAEALGRGNALALVDAACAALAASQPGWSVGIQPPAPLGMAPTWRVSVCPMDDPTPGATPTAAVLAAAAALVPAADAVEVAP
ncbi:MAG: hypothetical protein ABI780_01885 [Ardenticatenales bacterium]